MAVIDIRGTHGSGKSWIMHQLLTKYSPKPPQLITNRDTHEPIANYIPGLDLVIVGEYKSICGGCDQIKTADEVERRVRTLSALYSNVLLEGILVAHTYKRYANIAHDLHVYGYNFCFLDTPLKTCIARVRKRRLERGNDKEFDPRNVIKDYDRIWKRLRLQAETDGHSVVILPWRDPIPTILNLLQPPF